jgi:hypothetical protein
MMGWHVPGADPAKHKRADEQAGVA